MTKLLIFSYLALALPPVPKPSSGENSIRHQVIAGGETITEPKNCIEDEIRKRTIIVYVDNKRACSGVLLDNQTVALAAHCHPDAGDAKSRKILKDSEAAKLSSIVYYDSKSKAYKQGPAATKASMQFEGDMVNGTVSTEHRDMLVIKLAKPIPGITALKRVPKADLETRLDQDLIVAGFGLNEKNELLENVKYLNAQGKVSKGSETLQLYPNKNQDRVKLGDSGGPVFRANADTCEVELAGITKGVDESPAGKGFSVSDTAETISAHVDSLNQKSAPGKIGKWRTKTTVAPGRK